MISTLRPPKPSVGKANISAINWWFWRAFWSRNERTEGILFRWVKSYQLIFGLFTAQRSYRTLINNSFKDVRANCFCASLLRTAARANSHATSCIERARQRLKWTMIGQIAIAIALLGFNVLGRSVTSTFLFRNRFYLQLSPHCSKMSEESMWEVKKISRFLSTGHGILPSCSNKVCETMVAKCKLVLWRTSPVDWIRLIGHGKPYLTEKISLQSSNCNILGLAAIVAFFANEARFTQI